MAMRFRALLAVIVLVNAASPTTSRPYPEQRLRTTDWERYEDEAVGLFREYLRIDTSNPPGNELAAAEFFHRLFVEEGIPNTIYRYAPGRANISAVLKGDGSLRPLVLLNHLDGVRAESKNWRVPPF